MLKQIGNGSGCIVYLAEHRKLHQLCAVKCIPKGNNNGSIFLREAEFLRNLNHLYVPVLYDYEEDAGYWYLIEEYIEGQSLYYLGTHHTNFPQSRFIDLAIQICEAIRWLHERKPYPVLHLDLKPEHILVTDSGIRLLDFGSAVYLKDRRVSGNLMGTAGFAAPEQIRGEPVDERSDIFSLGAVFYWFMTGKTVVYDRDYEKVRNYSGEWNAIVAKCLEREAGKRYRSAGQLLESIRRLKRQKKGQFDKSMSIAVTGCQHRVGTTHFAIGLSISCKQLGMKSLYEEKNDSGAILEMFHNCKGVRERNGICYLPGFEAIPRYGQAVYGEVEEECVSIRDYGLWSPEKVEEYDLADAVIVIAGGKEWEIRQTKELIERYRKRRNLYYVIRAGKRADVTAIGQKLSVSRMFWMPEYADAFSVTWKERRFYKEILTYITAEMTGRR